MFPAEIKLGQLQKEAEESLWIFLWNEHIHVQQRPTGDSKMLSIVRKDFEKKTESCVLTL